MTKHNPCQKISVKQEKKNINVYDVKTKGTFSLQDKQAMNNNYLVT